MINLGYMVVNEKKHKLLPAQTLDPDNRDDAWGSAYSQRLSMGH